MYKNTTNTKTIITYQKSVLKSRLNSLHIHPNESSCIACSSPLFTDINFERNIFSTNNITGEDIVLIIRKYILKYYSFTFFPFIENSQQREMRKLMDIKCKLDLTQRPCSFNAPQPNKGNFLTTGETVASQRAHRV